MLTRERAAFFEGTREFAAVFGGKATEEDRRKLASAVWFYERIVAEAEDPATDPEKAAWLRKGLAEDRVELRRLGFIMPAYQDDGPGEDVLEELIRAAPRDPALA